MSTAILERNLPNQTEIKKNKGEKSKKAKNFTINMRIDAKRKALIEEAAKSRHTDRSNFILDAAYKAAEETILDRNVIILSDEDFNDFDRALSNEKLEDNKCLLKFLKKKSRWG